MISLVNYVLLRGFHVLLHVEIYLTMDVFDYSDNYYRAPTPKSEEAENACDFTDFVKGKCEGFFRTKLRLQYITTTTSVYVLEKDKVIPASSFSYSAFIIVMLTSLVVALFIALACCCCRTFFSRRAPSIHIDDNYTTIPMDRQSQSSENRASYLRTNSLPTFLGIVSSTRNSAIEQERPLHISSNSLPAYSGVVLSTRNSAIEHDRPLHISSNNLPTYLGDVSPTRNSAIEQDRPLHSSSNNLPTYSSVVSSTRNLAIEEPPPSYSSLFAATGEGNIS